MRPFGRQLIIAIFAVFTAGSGTGCISDASTTRAVTPNRAVGFASKPYMGWTSWNLEALNVPGYGADWQTAEHMRAQADLMHKILQPYGYTYLNVDSGWSYGYDRYGRPTPDYKKFPGGVAALAKYVHRYGQKLGIYWVPGIQRNVYDTNGLIYGTKYHIRDIVGQPLVDGNSFGGNWHLKIDFRKPGAQEYIDSVVRLMASWGVDYLKLDGVGPGSDSDVDNRADVEAYSKAIKKCGRPIWLELSWRLDHRYAGVWTKYAPGRRVNDDVASIQTHFSDWGHVQVRFAEAPAWTSDAGPGKGWNDFDAACVGDGSIDGLTDDERRTMMSFWAIECSPLYIGDDLSHLDALGRDLLTNREVIAIDQAGRPAVEMVGGAQQVWRTDNGDGTVTVDLVNLGEDTVTATANLSFLGFTGAQPIHDLWTHKDLGTYRGLYTVVLGPHASKLIRIGDTTGTPLSGGEGQGERSGRHALSVALDGNASLGASTRSSLPFREGAGVGAPLAVDGVRALVDAKSVNLIWNPSPGASHYVVWRSRSGHSGYKMIDADVHAPVYRDRSTVDGMPYYYQITAANSAGESPRSAPIGVQLPIIGAGGQPTGHPDIISVDFNGGAAPMDIDEIAGVVPAGNWNIGTARVGDLDLLDSVGNDTRARLIYVAGGTYLGVCPDRPGNNRMMCGYLETYGHDTTTLTVTSLPAAFTRRGYDVYVYCKGANAGSTRVARFTIGSTSLIDTNAANSDFDGTFKGRSTGDDYYVKFKNLTAASFTLKATPVSSSDQYLRAPINGIQIVAR